MLERKKQHSESLHAVGCGFLWAEVARRLHPSQLPSSILKRQTIASCGCKYTIRLLDIDCK